MNILSAQLVSAALFIPVEIRHITVIYNTVNKSKFGNVEDVLADAENILCAQAITDHLRTVGFKTDIFDLNEDTVHLLPFIKTDFFFNNCYGIGSIPHSEAEVAKIMDMLNIPYTGPEEEVINLTTDKYQTKKRFEEIGVPTPKYQLFFSESDRLDPSMRFPLIAKPRSEDCSYGIDNTAVVINCEELKRKVRSLINNYRQPVLIEEYIDGREFHVSILGNGERVRVLPPAEILFGKSFKRKNRWKILDFDSKWKEATESYKDTPMECTHDLTVSQERLLKEYAKEAYWALECKDYARMDVRMNENGEFYFLEANVNPSLNPTDLTARSAYADGMTYAQLVREIVGHAMHRFQISPKTSRAPYTAD